MLSLNHQLIKTLGFLLKIALNYTGTQTSSVAILRKKKILAILFQSLSDLCCWLWD